MFAAGLFALWHYQRQHRYIALLATAYVAKTLAFILQFVPWPSLEAPARLVSNILFMVTAVLLTVGLLARLHRSPPYRLLLGTAAASLIVLSWYLFVDPNFNARVIAMNAGFVIICGVVSVELRRVPRKNFVEYLLMHLFTLHAIVFVMRPLSLLVPTIGAPGINTSPLTSPYWLAVTLSDTLISMAMILALFAVVALDIVGRLKTESGRDPLSGLFNRRGLEERASAILETRPAVAPPSAMVLSDLDFFKAINDTYGHALGDDVIVAFARHLSAMAGETAVVARLGGEEFAVLFPDRDVASARLFAEGARASFAATPLPGLPDDVRVTASFGVAGAHVGEGLKELLRSADQALYKAKRDGRDCVRVAGASEAIPMSRDARVERLPLPRRRAQSA